MRTTAIVNQKGGCGKTTTAINLAAILARRGERTLLVDMDPQAHCAAGLGVPESRIEMSVGEALLADPQTLDPACLIWEVARNLDLLPSTMRLATLESPEGGLYALADRDRRLRGVLERLAPRYDRCVIDCPPTIGLLTFNALRACREVIVPVETGYFSLKGAEKQWETIQRVIRRIGRPIACHLLPTLHDPESALAADILAALRRQFAGQIMPLVIHEHAELREAVSLGQAITEYAPETPARREFEALAQWLDEHEVSPAPEIEIIAGAGSAPMRSPDGGASGPGQAFHDVWPVRGRAAELAGRLRDRDCEEPLTAAGSPEDDRGAGPGSWPAGMGTPGAPGAPVMGQGRGPVNAVSHVTTGMGLRAVPGPVRIPPRLHVHAAPASAASALLAVACHVHGGFASARFATPVRAPERPAYGVRRTSAGVRFVQPSRPGRTIHVAGDFNRWSPCATPLRPNPACGVDEATVALPPGRYQYRLVIDGRWEADPHNDARETNEHGELNSTFTVEKGHAAP